MPVAGRPESGLDRLAARERVLWVLALLGYGLGDLVTTLVGLSTGRAAEAGPVAGPVAEFGLPALVALKLASLVAFYLAWRLLPRPFRVAVPLAVAGVGAVVSAWNATVILT